MSRTTKKHKQRHRQNLTQLKAQKRKRRKSVPGILHDESGYSIRHPKMSQVISHLAEPLLGQFGASSAGFEFNIRLTIVAWNLALLPEEQQAERRQQFAESFLPAIKHTSLPWSRNETIGLLLELLELIDERKKLFYPEINSPILDVAFRHGDEEVYFEVMYTIPSQ